MRNNKLVNKIGMAGLLAAIGLMASTALAGAPGNMIDADGCEHAVGSYNPWYKKNYCGTATANPGIVLEHMEDGAGGFFQITKANTTAYGSFTCMDFNGIMASAYRGSFVANDAKIRCPGGLGVRPRSSICGVPSACGNK